MLYSCFDAKRALYRVYEDKRERPINGDLPVPSLPSDTGKIGVPAIEAARPFPGGATYRGDSWQPRGIIVRCPGLGLGSGDFELERLWESFWPLLMVGGTAVFLWWVMKKTEGME
jgi:hypothetical protein